MHLQLFIGYVTSWLDNKKGKNNALKKFYQKITKYKEKKQPATFRNAKKGSVASSVTTRLHYGRGMKQSLFVLLIFLLLSALKD